MAPQLCYCTNDAKHQNRWNAGFFAYGKTGGVGAKTNKWSFPPTLG